MVAIPKRFLSFLSPSVTMAFINSLPLHLDCLLVSHRIPLMRPPQVGCTPWVFWFVKPVEYLEWAGPNFMPNRAQSLFEPAMARIPFSTPTPTFQNTTYQIIYFILHFIKILFPYQIFIINSNHHSLTRPKATAMNLNNF